MSRSNGDKARYHRQRKAKAGKRNRWRQLRQTESKKRSVTTER